MKKTLLLTGLLSGLSLTCVHGQNIVASGGFEDGFGSGTPRTFTETANWFNRGTGDQTNVARRTDGSAPAGSFIGQINDRYDVVNAGSNFDASAFGDITHSQKTSYTINSGDTFSFSYDWQDRFNWNDGLDEVRLALFATDDDTLGGNVVWSSVHDSGISTADGAFQGASGTSSTVTAAAVDQILFVNIFGFQNNGALSGNTGFAGIDNVSVIPEPGSFALLGGLLALGVVVVRRRL